MSPEEGIRKRLGRWVQSRPALARPWRRIAVRRLVAHRHLAEAIPSLIAALASSDRQVAAAAAAALRDLDAPPAVDALCALWAKRRDSPLAQILSECRYQAGQPAELRVLSGLKAGRLKALKEAAEAIPSLVAALKDTDKTIAANARVLIEHTAADALVDYALDRAEGAALLPIINDRGVRHSIEGRWFLYLVLAGRFDEYLQADFEFQTLRAEFRAARPELQARIRDAIVRSGDVRMNPLFVMETRQALLADLSDHDAEVLVRVNARNQNWDELFRFLWVLPARHIASAVRDMAGAKWQPEDADRAALLGKLGALAKGSSEGDAPAAPMIALNPVLRLWFAGGGGEAAGKPESELRLRLADGVPPPEQIAALAALRAQRKLSDAVLDQAARSPHWLVRLVAVALGGAVAPAGDGGAEWFKRLQAVVDSAAVWSLKPCQVTRDGLAALQEGLAGLGDSGAAVALRLIEAVVAHYTAHDIEVEVGARVLIGEDSFEIAG